MYKFNGDYVSELTIKDVSGTINTMLPIEIFINDKKVWENSDGLDKYKEILEQDDKVVFDLRFVIDNYHHSIVYITTNQE